MWPDRMADSLLRIIRKPLPKGATEKQVFGVVRSQSDIGKQCMVVGASQVRPSGQIYRASGYIKTAGEDRSKDMRPLIKAILKSED